MIKAIIFDFDGTIMDTESTSFNIWREIYSTHGHELTLEKWAECVGIPESSFDPYEDLMELTGLPLDRMEMALTYVTRESELNKGLPLLPGIEKIILAAKSIGLKLGIASSADHNWIEEHLGRKRLLGRFDAIICREDTERHKPFPDPYLKAIEVLGCKPSEAIAIEDSPNGIKAAKAAGLFTVAVPNQVTHSFVGDEADLKLKSLADITLKELLARGVRMINNLINQVITDSSKYLAGFADMTGLINEKYSGYNYAISLARHLDSEIIDSIDKGPNRAYFDHYNEVNRELTEAVQKISAKLTGDGFDNIPINPTVTDDILTDNYYKTLRMAFSHKMAATRAGIGWIGKTDLLVTKEYGPRVRLASILLKERITEPNAPLEESLCGDCEVCVVNCPAQAATGELWNIHTDRDKFYNPFKCMKKCRELSLNNLNEHISLCGICVSLCPKGRQT